MFDILRQLIAVRQGQQFLPDIDISSYQTGNGIGLLDHKRVISRVISQAFNLFIYMPDYLEVGPEVG